MGEDETERVARRIEEDPKVVPPGLGVRLRRTDGEDGLLTGVEISDIEIDVELLGVVRTRPCRGLMPGAAWKAIVAPCGPTSSTQSSSAPGSPRSSQPVTAA